MIEKTILRRLYGCLLIEPKLVLAFFICSLAAFSASAQNRRAQEPRRTSAYVEVDSVVYEETEITFRQASYLPLLRGDWNLTVMKQQARMAAQNLAGINLIINEDSTFSLSTACGKATGSIMLKGTSIKFNKINYTADKNCADAEQIDRLLELLSNRVSYYAVTSASLILRDGSANNVFEAVASR